MKKFATIFFVAILFGIGLKAETPELPSSFTVTLAQDPAFGFYPAVYGSIGLSETTSLTCYGVFWTSPGTGNHSSVDKIGYDLLTEFGIGLNFSMMDGALNVNPSVGLANGIYQSGSERPVVGDNIVPQCAVTYATESIYLPMYIIYWKALRKEGLVTLDLIDWCVMPGLNVNKNLTVGLCLDHLLTTVNANDESLTTTSYLWLGPYLKLNIKNASVSFSAGLDLVDYTTISAGKDQIKDFYKLTTSISF